MVTKEKQASSLWSSRESQSRYLFLLLGLILNLTIVRVLNSYVSDSLHLFWDDEELLLLGFISLLLTVLQGPISDICISEEVGSTWHPCDYKSNKTFTGKCAKKARNLIFLMFRFIKLIFFYLLYIQRYVIPIYIWYTLRTILHC